jgi:hypothetical protein
MTMTDQAAKAADEAVEKMAALRAEVQQKRAQDKQKLVEARAQNQQLIDKAIADAQAKQDGKKAVPPLAEREEPKYTFFDTEDECSVSQPPSAVMPEFTPPPRPTPRRHARPVIDDDDDDYSNQSWLR